MKTALLAALLLAGGTAAAQPPKDVAFDQRVGASLPLDAPMRAEDGSAVTVGGLLAGKPTLWVPVYFRCPMLCPLSLDGLMKALRVVPLSVGSDYDVIVFSFDPADGPSEAAKRRDELVRAYRRPGSARGFRVITGTSASIGRLTRALGLRFSRDAASGEYAHAPGAVVVTPEGRAARYFLGLEYSARDLRLALVEASAGKLGRWTDQVLLLCFHYDESLSRHTTQVLEALRFLGLATVLVIGGGVWLAVRGEALG